MFVKASDDDLELRTERLSHCDGERQPSKATTSNKDVAIFGYRHHSTVRNFSMADFKQISYPGLTAQTIE